jgi:transcriptional regulator with XRE-family HTH domain
MAKKRALLTLVTPKSVSESRASERSQSRNSEKRASKLAEELRRIRDMRGISLRKIEDSTKISNAYLSQLETGKAENPSPAVLYKLAKVLTVPYESLMEAAGYLTPSESKSPSPRRLSGIEAALLSADLTPEEQKQVAAFVSFLRKNRDSKSKK